MSNANSKAVWGVVLVTACLISGNLVGAGILGLPINTGLAGMIPSLIAMIAGGGMMFLTAIILGDQAKKSEGKEAFDYPSLYEKFLGKVGKWIAVLANMLILYGLLTAYFTGGAKILTTLFKFEGSGSIVFFGFAAFLIIITCINLTFLQKLNTLFIVCLATAFIVLVVMGVGNIEVSRMSYTDWSFLPATLPIIVTAFHFHNIIPTVVSDLNYDVGTYRKSVFIGMSLAFIMNAVWIAVGIGAIPLTGDNSLLNAYETNLPATVPLGAQIHSGVFTFFSFFFALIAISTSFLANGIGLQGFIKDMLFNSFKVKSRIAVIIFTFLPPLAISYLYPDIFLKALDVVGGVGIVTLFGVLPVLITILDKSSSKKLKTICVFALVFAIVVLIVEIMQETGMLDLKPWVEYHKNNITGSMPK